MTGSPFDQEDGVYLVPADDERQRSPWPIAVPTGWTIAHGEDTRQAVLAHVEADRTDLRPASLAAAVDTD